MRGKSAKQLMMADILDTIQNHSLTESREILYKSIGAEVEVSGTVQKKIKRHEHLRLLIQPTHNLSVFAEFTDEKEADKVNQSKIRKGAKIQITGKFLASGTSAVNLNYCRLKK